MSPQITLADFLAAEDLDDLAELASRIREWDQADERVVREVLGRLEDCQAAANLLMHPHLIPADLRLPSVLAGLSAPAPSYLRLAAAVGATALAELDPTLGPQPELVGALLDLVADNAGVVARRAATSVAPYLQHDDSGDVVVLLVHPDPGVRRNLHNALLDLLSPTGLEELLDDPREVPRDLAVRVRKLLAEDGRGHSPLSDLQRMPLLAWIPNRSDWTDGPFSPLWPDWLATSTIISPETT